MKTFTNLAGNKVSLYSLVISAREAIEVVQGAFKAYTDLKEATKDFQAGFIAACKANGMQVVKKGEHWQIDGHPASKHEIYVKAYNALAYQWRKLRATDSKATATDSKATATDSKATATDSKATATGSKATATDSKATATGSKATATGSKATDSSDDDKYVSMVESLTSVEFSMLLETMYMTRKKEFVVELQKISGKTLK